MKKLHGVAALPSGGRVALALVCATLGLHVGPPRVFGQSTPAIQHCELKGRVTSAKAPLPGVALAVSSPEGPPRLEELGGTSELAAAATGMDGTYLLPLGAPGAYRVRASLAGFADVVREVTLEAGVCSGTADFELLLLSRAPKVAPARTIEIDQTTGQADAPIPAKPEPPARTETAAASPAPGRSPNPAQAAARRFRDVGVVSDPGAEAAREPGADTADLAAQSLLPAGFSPEAATESVAMTGNQVQTVDALLFRDRLQMLEEMGGDIDALARRMAQAGMEGGGPGGRLAFPGGGGAGGFGGGFGPGAGGLGPGGGGRGNRIQGTTTYTVSGSPFDASPYALTGRPSEKADYLQHRYGATVGGPLRIPGIYNGTSRTSFMLSYSGAHTKNPYDAYSNVPTAAQREGDFAGLGKTIFDPLSNQPFANNVIPGSRIDPAARALLPFLPLPNQPGLTQNFHYVTANANGSDEVSLRINHMFGSAETNRRGGQQGQAQGRQPGQQQPRGGGQQQGGRPGGGGFNVVRRPMLNATISYRHSSRADTAIFPTLGGSSQTSAWDIPVSFSFSHRRIFHQVRASYNRSRADGLNLYAYKQDVAGGAGIQGVSRDPFDWGVPNLSFTSLADLRDRNPSFRLDQRFSIADTMMRTWRRHTFRLGGEFRAQRLDSQTDTNARGNFVFTGLYTAGFADGATMPGTGLDFADFLLGRPQQASIQFGPGRVRFSSRSWSVFLQDDWRVRNNLTLNLGLRYEYVSPYEEKNGHLVNLDVTPGFTAAAPVTAGQMGAFTGEFPDGIVYGDRDNIAPRIGIAWKPKGNLTLRGGVGINYNLGAYGAIAQRVAGQPPFAVSNTIAGSRSTAISLGDPFSRTPASATTNSYGIDKHYELPAVAIWNLDVQRDIAGGFLAAAGYSGTSGWDLDIQRAPNRGPTGLRIPGVAPFVWQSSEGESIMHSLTLRMRKRMTHGFGGGMSYTLGKSTDNASAIGGGASVVAQNDQDLEAERGRSSFDRRHRFAADAVVEPPIGPGRKWLREGLLSNILGGWVWNGTLAIESGSPFTARVVGDFADVARGVNGTLRANLTGQEMEVSNPTPDRWFNTAAFVAPPAGTFGNAGRNTITGPGSFLVNMGLTKNVSLGRPRALSIRVQASNVFNTAQFTAIDTVVNSPTFGRVIRAGTMRSLQIQTRFRF